MATYTNLFLTFLNKQDDASWSQAIDLLAPSIHPVDQAATRIWFSFFPLKLLRELQTTTTDLTQTLRELKLQGKYRLADQVDTSAEFLYGHRYWAEVKRAVAHYTLAPGTPAGRPLGKCIQEVAEQVAESLDIDASLLIGITAVAFMTLQQVGYEGFTQSSASASLSPWTQSPEQVLKARAKTESIGFFDFLKLGEKAFTVTFREYDRESHFKVIRMQEMASGAAQDKRDYKSRDARCVEGPIPVECRSAACGTCWVGVLAGAENLSEPADLEIRRMKEFGYPNFRADQSSMIRLACQAKCYGNVTIAIPPWNGVIGKLNH